MTHVFVFTCCVHNGFCEAALIISPYRWSTAAISTLQSTGITFYPHGCHCARNCYVPTLYKTQWRLAVGLISRTFQRQYMKHLHAGIIVTWWNYWHTSQPLDLLAVIMCVFLSNTRSDTRARSSVNSRLRRVVIWHSYSKFYNLSVVLCPTYP